MAMAIAYKTQVVGDEIEDTQCDEIEDVDHLIPPL